MDDFLLRPRQPVVEAAPYRKVNITLVREALFPRLADCQYSTFICNNQSRYPVCLVSPLAGNKKVRLLRFQIRRTCPRFFEFDFPLGNSCYEQPRFSAGQFVRFSFCSIRADNLWVPFRLFKLAGVQYLQWLRPSMRLGQLAIETYIDPLLCPVLVFGPVQKHHPRIQVCIPVYRRTPERIGIGPVPIDKRRKNSRHMPADARLAPPAFIPFEYFALGIIQVFKVHPRHRHALLRHVLVIGADKKVQVFILTICNDREITVAPHKVLVRRVEIVGTARCFEYDTEVPPV